MFHKTSKAPPEACSRRHRARGVVTHGGGASAEGIGEEDRRERQACERAETLRHTRCGTLWASPVHVALLGGPGHHPRRARPGEPLPQVRARHGRLRGNRAVPQMGVPVKDLADYQRCTVGELDALLAETERGIDARLHELEAARAKIDEQRALCACAQELAQAGMRPGEPPFSQLLAVESDEQWFSLKSSTWTAMPSTSHPEGRPWRRWPSGRRRAGGTQAAPLREGRAARVRAAWWRRETRLRSPSLRQARRPPLHAWRATSYGTRNGTGQTAIGNAYWRATRARPTGPAALRRCSTRRGRRDATRSTWSRISW